MDRPHMSVDAGRDPRLRSAFKDDNDGVKGQIVDQQPVVQPASRFRSITPPAVGATAHHVRPVDDQNRHESRRIVARQARTTSTASIASQPTTLPTTHPISAAATRSESGDPDVTSKPTQAPMRPTT